MPGLIRRSDIDEVRSRTNIADIVGDFVTLKSAGVGSLKGLCPFHEERSPSFHVRPQVGFYHCFGCGEGGDVFTFLQRMDHVTFQEAVERLAGRLGYELHYEDGAQATDHGNRARLLAANAAAERFFQEQLATSAAQIGRNFLGERGFDQAAAGRFGIGFAPKSFSALADHLKAQGFTEQELTTAGLLATGDRGNSYDRFRGRLIWPIRDVTGQTIGFGARKLLGDDEDKGPKYLNTPETPVYHKSQVLYGLDLARRDISRDKNVVVVEGYTDVMACHLAGVTTAVATCGTSFGVDHIRVLRRILGDIDNADTKGTGRVIFTFDPDEAGQKAASRAFADEQTFAAQTFVAVAPDGLDPCDLRLQRGDEAVRSLIEHQTPMFEFMIRRSLAAFDIATAEGRTAGLRVAVPIIATIRDRALSTEYERQLARMTGTEVLDVRRMVQQQRHRGRPAGGSGPPGSPSSGAPSSGAQSQGAQSAGPQSPGTRSPGSPSSRPQSGERPSDARTSSATTLADRPGDAAAMVPERPVAITDLPVDPVTRSERDALIAILQRPTAIGPELVSRAMRVGFRNPTLAAVRDAIAAHLDRQTAQTWLADIAEATPAGFSSLVTQLGIAPILEREDRLDAYCRSVVVDLIVRDILREKAEVLGAMQRASADGEQERWAELSRRSAALETERRQLRSE